MDSTKPENSISATAEKHRYEYDIDLDSDVAPARILRMVSRNARVLEIGAGPGSVTKYLCRVLNCNVTAVDIDPTTIERLKGYTSSVYMLDLNNPTWGEALRQQKEGPFDYIIAADVLEHVYDPWTTLGVLKTLLNDGGYVLLSIPHVGHASIGACLIDEDFEYRPWGLLDQTHIRFFGIKNIQQLCVSQGFCIEQAEFVVRSPEMTEFAHRWIRLPQDVRRALQRNRFSDVYQVVVKIAPAEWAKASIRLLDLPVPPPSRSISNYWKTVMATVRPSDNNDATFTTTDRSIVARWRMSFDRFWGKRD